MKTIKAIFTILIMLFALTSCKKDSSTSISGELGLKVKDGKYLVDQCGNKVILRGVNMGSIYAVNFGLKEIEEIEKTGANSVRIVLEQNYKDWSNGGAITTLTAAKIEPIIKGCIAKGMIPILEIHDFTGSANVSADLPKATQWWTKQEIKNMLLKYQKSLILNIANEPDNGNTSDATYANANLSAIKTLRAAGYTIPIMIDAPNWGKNHMFFLNKGQSLMDADPLHNLIFSVHAYWPTNGAFGNYSDSKIIDNINALKQTGLPIMLGELALADIQNGLTYNINYKLLMKLCQENEFGYAVWWWGFNNNPQANNQLSMTNNGLLSGLQGGGKIMALDDANSIKNTAKRICK